MISFVFCAQLRSGHVVLVVQPNGAIRREEKDPNDVSLSAATPSKKWSWRRSRRATEPKKCFCDVFRANVESSHAVLPADVGCIHSTPC